MLVSSAIATLFGAMVAAMPIDVPATTPATSEVTSEVTSTDSDMSIQAGSFQDAYKMYNGDGSHFKAGWPNMDFWGSWDQLWNANAPLMRKSCGWNGWGKDNSETELGYIRDAVTQVAGEAGLDRRFILAVVMQESKGCVRVPTTANGVTNPGLMQSHNGSGSCAGVANCSKATIVQMIRDGSSGTAYGDGLKQTLAFAKAKIGSAGAQAQYAAARKYNSGSVDFTNLNNGFTSDRCYAVDIANRLTGWTTDSLRKCQK